MTRCTSESLFHDGAVCVRPEGHLGLHRNTVRVSRIAGKTISWGNNEERVRNA